MKKKLPTKLIATAFSVMFSAGAFAAQTIYIHSHRGEPRLAPQNAAQTVYAQTSEEAPFRIQAGKRAEPKMAGRRTFPKPHRREAKNAKSVKFGLSIFFG